MEKDNIKGNFPEKKDFIYWIILLFIILVLVIVWRVKDPKMLADQITLGAALFSILLAVVGIIIPYIQGNETNRQNFQMLGEINRITESIVGLSSLKEELSKNINQQITLSKKYGEMLDEVSQKLIDNHEEGKDGQDATDLQAESLKKAKEELKKNMYKLEQESIFFNNMTPRIVITSEMKERAILKFIKVIYPNGVSIAELRKGLMNDGMPIGKPELQNIISTLEKKGRVTRFQKNGQDAVSLI